MLSFLMVCLMVCQGCGRRNGHNYKGIMFEFRFKAVKQNFIPDVWQMVFAI